MGGGPSRGRERRLDTTRSSILGHWWTGWLKGETRDEATTSLPPSFFVSLLFEGKVRPGDTRWLSRSPSFLFPMPVQLNWISFSDHFSCVQPVFDCIIKDPERSIQKLDIDSLQVTHHTVIFSKRRKISTQYVMSPGVRWDGPSLLFSFFSFYLTGTVDVSDSPFVYWNNWCTTILPWVKNMRLIS